MGRENRQVDHMSIEYNRNMMKQQVISAAGRNQVRQCHLTGRYL